MTMNTTTIQALSFKTERDLLLINILSALLIAAIAFFPNSPARIILGLPFILFFPGYMLICALFPRKTDLDIIERLTLSFGLSIAVTSLIGLTLNYTPFGIRLYPVTFSLFSFTLLMSAVAIYRRRIISLEDVFAPLASISILGWRGFRRVKSEFMKFGNGDISLKIIATIAFVLITLVLIIIARTPPASGYEISIYEAYPIYFWFFLMASIACGLSILVFSAFSNREGSSYLWALGFFAILLCNVIILLLPQFRGYTFYGRGDPLIHAGEIKDILSFGHTGEWNFYPVMHILATSLLYATGLNLRWIPGIIPPFFSLLYPLFIYLLSRAVSKNRGQSLLITAFGSLMVFGFEQSRLAPTNLCFFIVPLILFLYYKSSSPSSRMEYSVLFVLLLLLVPFFHPWESMDLVLIFLCFNASVLIYRVVNRLHVPSLRDLSSAHAIRVTPSLMVFVTFFIWFSSFSAFGGTTRTVTDWLFHHVGNPEIAMYSEILARANLSIPQFIELFLKMYGQFLLYIVVAVILCIVILRRTYSSQDMVNLSQIKFMVMFAIFGILTLMFLFGDFIIGCGRIRRYSILAATVLNGLGLYTLYHKNASRSGKPLMAKMIPFMVVILLVASSGFSTFNIFFSPITRSANHQVTQMEMNGMEWLLDYSDEEILIDDLSFEQYRFTYALMGPNAAKGVKNIRSWSAVHHPPRHFNYTQNRMLGQSYQEDRYLVITKLCRESAHRIFPEYSDKWSFNPNDFNNLDGHDPSVSRVYANNEVDIFYVRSQPL